MRQVITPSQALLLLIDHYAANPVARQELETLYLVGADTPARQQRIKYYFSQPILRGTVVDSSPSAIQQDPTRRYFETQLAYCTLKSWLARLSLDKLRTLQGLLIDKLSTGGLIMLESTLNQSLSPQAPLIMQEFAELFSELMHPAANFPFNVEETAALHLLMCNAYLCVILACTTALPLDIYNKGIFHPSVRGVILRMSIASLQKTPQLFSNQAESLATSDQRSTRSQARGIFTSLMPLPREDVLWRQSSSTLTRAPDRSHYDRDSCFVQVFFNQQVHPFVNSLSGTVLSHLRAVLLLLESQQLAIDDQDNMRNYFRCLIAGLLYLLGGHSLAEFCMVLNLRDVTQAFDTTLNFCENPLQRLFQTDNQPALTQALAATQAFQRQWLQQRKALTELRGLFANRQAFAFRSQSQRKTPVNPDGLLTIKP